MTPAVVFDCMVLLQAASRPAGPAGACWRAIELGLATLHVSPTTRSELEEVISRPGLRARFRTLTDERIAAFLRSLDRLAISVQSVPEVFTLTRDPKDAKYLNLVLAVGAKFVVSRDNDLLDLMTGTDADAVAFRSTCPDTVILDPVAFLRALRPDPPTSPDALPVPPAGPDAPSN